MIIIIIIADGESVGLVCLSVHYKNSGMFMAHDVKAHAPLQHQYADAKRARRSLMISYQPFRARSPARPAPLVEDNQYRFRDPTKAEMRRFFAKKGSEAYPIAVARLKRQRVP